MNLMTINPIVEVVRFNGSLLVWKLISRRDGGKVKWIHQPPANKFAG